ncbi:DUF4097 family beta strand repeat-containing protein [Subtercola lobariae]|uniref:Adhesin domain-containing protein n=1 Tax=Subtercola lobariae TaxID=1588641 RepID=A0A917BAM0_9MICO|nr:hypothetical protein [Subtercola lobariae]GGF31490.1 hypothetical protein GCM10011399_25810 [Subtercola lobariae]
MPTYPTPRPIDLDITVTVGDVEITASDTPETVVDVVPSRPSRPGDVSLAKEATVRFDGGRLTVVVPKRLNLFGPGDSVDVRIEAPAGSTATIVSAYGGVRVRGALGDSDITASYGRVQLERTGSLRLKAPYGEVEVADVAGDLDLTAGHARLHIARVDGTANIRGSHGDIELGSVTGDVDVRTSAAISIDRAAASVAIRTAHGAIRVKEVTGGTVRLENGYAGIEVGVPEGTAAWIDAASRQGVVRNELTAESGPEGADRTVELRLRANYGDILIHRAQPARAN